MAPWIEVRGVRSSWLTTETNSSLRRSTRLRSKTRPSWAATWVICLHQVGVGRRVVVGEALDHGHRLRADEDGEIERREEPELAGDLRGGQVRVVAEVRPEGLAVPHDPAGRAHPHTVTVALDRRPERLVAVRVGGVPHAGGHELPGVVGRPEARAVLAVGDEEHVPHGPAAEGADALERRVEGVLRGLALVGAGGDGVQELEELGLAAEPGLGAGAGR